MTCLDSTHHQLYIGHTALSTRRDEDWILDITELSSLRKMPFGFWVMTKVIDTKYHKQ